MEKKQFLKHLGKQIIKARENDFLKSKKMPEFMAAMTKDAKIADARSHGVEAGVQPAHEQPHVRPDAVGQGPPAHEGVVTTCPAARYGRRGR